MGRKMMIYALAVIGVFSSSYAYAGWHYDLVPTDLDGHQYVGGHITFEDGVFGDLSGRYGVYHDDYRLMGVTDGDGGIHSFDLDWVRWDGYEGFYDYEFTQKYVIPLNVFLQYDLSGVGDDTLTGRMYYYPLVWDDAHLFSLPDGSWRIESGSDVYAYPDPTGEHVCNTDLVSHDNGSQVRCVSEFRWERVGYVRVSEPPIGGIMLVGIFAVFAMRRWARCALATR